MNNLQKSSVLPVVGVMAVILIGVVMIGLFGRNGTTVPLHAAGLTLTAPVSAADHVLGDVTAPVTIVEYADFQCPSCKATSPVLSKLVADEAGKVSVVYRYFTLPQHKNAISSARASEAAALQGKFWEMHDRLFETQTDWENDVDPTKLFEGYAANLGLDIAKFRADLNVDSVTARVTQDTADAKTNKLNHTPTIFINGKELTTAPTYDGLKSAVEAVIAVKK